MTFITGVLWRLAAFALTPRPPAPTQQDTHDRVLASLIEIDLLESLPVRVCLDQWWDWAYQGEDTPSQLQ